MLDADRFVAKLIEELHKGAEQSEQEGHSIMEAAQRAYLNTPDTSAHFACAETLRRIAGCVEVAVSRAREQ